MYVNKYEFCASSWRSTKVTSLYVIVSNYSTAVVGIYTVTRLHSMCGDPVPFHIFSRARVRIPTFTKDGKVVVCSKLNTLQRTGDADLRF